LVPDPDVLHLDLEQRVGGLDPRLQLHLVAEVGGVRGEHAVTEQREDRRVLLLQLELEIGLELVELVEVRHHADCSPATRSASGSSANRRWWRRGWGTSSPGSSIRSSPYRSRSRSIVLGPKRGPSRV